MRQLRQPTTCTHPRTPAGCFRSAYSHRPWPGAGACGSLAAARPVSRYTYLQCALHALLVEGSCPAVSLLLCCLCVCLPPTVGHITCRPCCPPSPPPADDPVIPAPINQLQVVDPAADTAQVAEVLVRALLLMHLAGHVMHRFEARSCCSSRKCTICIAAVCARHPPKLLCLTGTLAQPAAGCSRRDGVPMPRYRHTMVVWQDALYVYGGELEGRSSEWLAGAGLVARLAG